MSRQLTVRTRMLVRDLCGGILEKKEYQPENNLVKDENGHLPAYSHNSLNRWKNYFFQLLNVHGFSDVRHIEIHTAEPSHFEFEIAVAELK
jgi:hypothetical protein